ncbi:MAG: helix-turn-helix domain-containing protein [Burkholderiales bacterium]
MSKAIPSLPASAWETFSRRVGVALALQRRSRGLSQQQVGEAIGVEPETISRMETGVISPSLKRLYQLAVVLDCPLDALLGRASVLPHDLLRQLSDPLSVLSDSERAFVIHQSLSLASWLAERDVDRNVDGFWAEGPPGRHQNQRERVTGGRSAIRLQDGDDQPRSPMRSKSSEQDGDPEI